MPVHCHLTLVIGPERKSGFLDEEFNRVTETLDKEYKRLSYALSATNFTLLLLNLPLYRVLSMEPPNLLPQQTSQLPPVTPQALEVVNELPTVESASPAKHIPPPSKITHMLPNGRLYLTDAIVNPPKPSDTVEPAR